MASPSQPPPGPSDVPEESRRATLVSLLEVDDGTIQQLSRLTLPEIQAVKQEVAQVLPAGNLPAFILSGLLKLKGRQVSRDQVSRDIAALMRGMSLIPEGLYGAFIAGPAAVLYAYQRLLQLAGKDAADAFPDGTWQFYLQFGLREDTARHTNETAGFHRALPAQADPVAMAGAWVCAALELVYYYDELLAANWTEGVMLRLLMEEMSEVAVGDRTPFVTLVRDWHRMCPYHRPSDGSPYVAHRQAVFRRFLQERLKDLPPAAMERFQQRYAARLVEELPAYQNQMTLLAVLQPDLYQERKEPIAMWQACLAFVWQERTYLLPACQQYQRGSPLCYRPYPDDAHPVPLDVVPNEGSEASGVSGELCEPVTRRPLLVDRSGRVWYRESGQLMGCLRPPTPQTVTAWLAAIFSSSHDNLPPTLDLALVDTPRPIQAELRASLPGETQAELAALRRVPIIINWDIRSHAAPLAYIRRGRRGIGDHALTMLRTEQSMVFDQSHIFFDGAGGLAVAEILTDAAVHWYQRLAGNPHVRSGRVRDPAQAPAPSDRSGRVRDPAQLSAPAPLRLKSSAQVEAICLSHYRPCEVAAESDGVEVERLSRLREWLLQRGVPLSINDVLLLYRVLHAGWYEPSPASAQAQEAFHKRATSREACTAYQAIETTLARLQRTNPALLIPMDASAVSPVERVFPTTFRNPLVELGERFMSAKHYCRVYQADLDSDCWLAFDQARRELLTYLKAFGELMDALKAVTMRGESFNTATIRLLAHLPRSMQYLLDQIPQHIGVLNEIIKGSEVFSNVGRVAPGTSLTRFMSAKDDGQTKELIWGILTDDQGRMRITLRDFRPFVPRLLALGEAELANLLAQDYLDSYVQGLNRFVAELSAMITLKEQAPS